MSQLVVGEDESNNEDNSILLLDDNMSERAGAKKGNDDDDVSINSELDFNGRQHGISFDILHSKDILEIWNKIIELTIIDNKLDNMYSLYNVTNRIIEENPTDTLSIHKIIQIAEDISSINKISTNFTVNEDGSIFPNYEGAEGAVTHYNGIQARNFRKQIIRLLYDKYKNIKGTQPSKYLSSLKAPSIKEPQEHLDFKGLKEHIMSTNWEIESQKSFHSSAFRGRLSSRAEDPHFSQDVDETDDYGPTVPPSPAVQMRKKNSEELFEFIPSDFLLPGTKKKMTPSDTTRALEIAKKSSVGTPERSRTTGLKVSSDAVFECVMCKEEGKPGRTFTRAQLLDHISHNHAYHGVKKKGKRVVGEETPLQKQRSDTTIERRSKVSRPRLVDDEPSKVLRRRSLSDEGTSSKSAFKMAIPVTRTLSNPMHSPTDSNKTGFFGSDYGSDYSMISNNQKKTTPERKPKKKEKKGGRSKSRRRRKKRTKKKSRRKRRKKRN